MQIICSHLILETKRVVPELSLYYDLKIVNFNAIQVMHRFVEFFILTIVTEEKSVYIT